jgi:glycosyltransferase involved in cell wall biosynthesis
MNISVLMAIYYKEDPIFFDLAMQSIWDRQVLKPNQIVLVVDGKLTESLYKVLNNWKSKLGSILTVVPLDCNVGLGNALEVGLKHCSNELIARMDSDDMSNPERFLLQRNFLETNNNIDVVGTFISEMDQNSNITRDVVKYPLTHDKMLQFFAKRDPLAHVTVMFRRCFFEKSSNYSGDLRMAEDTLLWHKGFLSGCKFANITYRGVSVRQTNDFYARRGDMSKALGLLNFRLFVINKKHNFGLAGDLYALLYFLMSISPGFVKRFSYRMFR